MAHDEGQGGDGVVAVDAVVVAVAHAFPNEPDGRFTGPGFVEIDVFELKGRMGRVYNGSFHVFVLSRYFPNEI